MWTRIRNVTNLIVLAFIVGCAGAAEAATMKDSSAFNLQINGDTNPTAVLGSNTWSTDGGIISYTANPSGDGMFGWEGALNSANGFTMELRYQVTQPHSSSDAVFALLASDGGGEYFSLLFDAVQVYRLGSAGNHTPLLPEDKDFMDGYHTVRVAKASDSETLTVWVDDELITTSFAKNFSFALNRAYLGDSGSFTNSGAADIDYFRVDTTGAFGPVPEPASLALMGVGSLLLLGRRR